MSIVRRNTTKLEKKGELSPNSKLFGVIDGDAIKYPAAGIGEERYILVTLPEEKTSIKSPSRTDFYGQSKKITGELAKINAKRVAQGLPEYTREDCVIEDHIISGHLGTCKTQATNMIYNWAKAAGVKDFKLYLGKGESFRVGLSTLKEYKGNRKKLLKSPNLEKVVDYLQNQFNPNIITGIETDDALVMAAYGDGSKVVIGEDKDFRGQPVLYFDINNPEEGIINGNCFGKLEDRSKSEVSGSGQKLLVWQLLTGKLPEEYKQFQNLVESPMDDLEASGKLRYVRSVKSLQKALGEGFEPFLEAINSEEFGSLKVDRKVKILGYGRLFLYWQILAGDSSDNYKASEHSPVDMGAIGAYNLLVNCKTDKEALDVLIATFKEMYPSSSQHIKACHSEMYIPINWYYVLNEQFQMARMMRWEGDIMSFDKWYEIYSEEKEL